MTAARLDQLDQSLLGLYVGQVDQQDVPVTQTYNLYDAKTRLSELVDRASAISAHAFSS